MTDQSKIIARIKALIAKANSTEHEAEAEAFMAKAASLLEEHQIDASKLDTSGDPVIVKADAFEQTDSSPSWYKDLYVALGALFGCRAVKQPKIIRTSTGLNRWGYAIELTGRESAIVTTDLMFPWVKSQVLAKGREVAKVTGKPPAKQARLVGNALVRRIYRLVALERARTVGDGPKTEAARNALVVKDQVDAKFEEHYGDELDKERNVQRKSDWLSREAADSIGLHRQAGASETLQIGAQ
ncbi:MAG TPA: DUF2786 domain-containing protein [Sphingomicrobium sp.]|jgi:hypothetical protein|nr:DUF2786 domain-containing protein [Sphingomicrobium sp.]